MAAPSPSASRRNARNHFVSDWEELPEGEWLDNDEDGVHWYRTAEGEHWHSTEGGFQLWVDEDEAFEETDNESSDHLDSSSSQIEDREDEEDLPATPRPTLDAGTAVFGLILSLLVVVWTLFITIPTAELNLETLSSASSTTDEMDQTMLDGLERYQTLNTLTLLLASVGIVVGALGMAKRTPWWTMIASHASLLSLLLAASVVALAAERSRLEQCDPSVYYCYQLESSSMFLIDSIYPTMLIMVTFLYILNRSVNTWVNFDVNEDQTTELNIQLFSKGTPKLGGFTSMIGLLMSLSILAITYFFFIPATDENILTFGGELSTQGEGFQTVQFYNLFVVRLSGFVAFVSLLSLVKKTPWWALPASCFALLCVLFITVKESNFNGLSVYEQDSFYTGMCSMVALVFIGAGAFRTMMNHDWEEDDDDYGGYENARGSTGYNLFDEEEDDLEWRAKVKTVVMASVMLLAGVGGFFLIQFVVASSNEPLFQIRDANGNLSEGRSDELVVIDMLDKTNAYSEETIKVSIQINGGDELTCKWERSGSCTYEYLELFDDRRLTALESILISEGTTRDLCSDTSEQGCKITVFITHERSEEDEDMMVTVESIDLGSYTLVVA